MLWEGGMSTKNGEGGGRLRMKILVGGKRSDKNGKWEAGGRVKLLVGGVFPLCRE